MAPFECDYGYHVTIGARTFINYGAVILDGAKVTIGQDVQIGPSVQLLTATHPLDPVERRRGTETAKPVTIGDGAWLATGVIVVPGRERSERTRSSAPAAWSPRTCRRAISASAIPAG